MEHEWEDLAMEPLEFDLKVRSEANVGFEQIRNIERHLRSAPQGLLGKTDDSEAQALRAAIVSASATIMGSFSKVISLLTALPISSHRYDNFSVLLGHPGPDHVSCSWAEEERRMGKAKSPMPSGYYSDTTPPLSPSVLLPPVSSSKLMKNRSSTNSPLRTSPHGSVTAISEGSPPNQTPSPIGFDSETDAGVHQHNEASTSAADGETNEQRSLTKKRKFMSKLLCKQRAQGVDPLNDGPPDDGYTWRKYGQKDILGSRFPRSYYRCTFKMELGCEAIKYVQRSDEDPTVFDVTYRGSHNSQCMQQQQTPWHFSSDQFSLGIRAQSPQLPIFNSNPTSSVLRFPDLVGNKNINTSFVVPALAPNHVSYDHHVIDSSSAFPSQLGGVDLLPLTVMPPASVGLVSNPLRFGINHSPREMDINQQPVLYAKPEDIPSQQQPLYNLVNRSPRDSLFGPDSNLLNMLLASSKPQDSMEF